MKKLILILAAACCLTACNKELGPEYKTPAEFVKVTFDASDVQPDESVVVSASLTSTYGLSLVFINYSLNGGDAVTEEKSIWHYAPSDVKANYTGTIPGQEAGTKVAFAVLAYTPYGVYSWSDTYEYTVAGDPEEGGGEGGETEK